MAKYAMLGIGVLGLWCGCATMGVHWGLLDVSRKGKRRKGTTASREKSESQQATKGERDQTGNPASWPTLAGSGGSSPLCYRP
eukprot:1185108-Prorocentrum_minimum.AAC.2